MEGYTVSDLVWECSSESSFDDDEEEEESDDREPMFTPVEVESKRKDSSWLTCGVEYDHVLQVPITSTVYADPSYAERGKESASAYKSAIASKVCACMWTNGWGHAWIIS